MRGPAKLASYIGIAMVVAGFVVIALAWNGAAGTDFLQSQFPYLLSGGLGGLGLIVAGAAVMYVQAAREVDATEAAHYARVVSSLQRTAAALRGGGTATAAVSLLEPTGTVQVVTQRAVTADDPTVVSDTAWSAPADAATTGEALVVAGRSSFHDPSCHLVNTRDDLDLLRRQDATGAGLKPCRVCKP